MTGKSKISLREYLHLLARRVKNPPCIEDYDEFLLKVWDFFSLRSAAEAHFDLHRHVAFSRNGALPIEWEDIKRTLHSSGPPEQVITQIAKRNYSDVAALAGNLRKALSRERRMTPAANVQQLDSHCLRWLTRQPGRTAAEKGGVRQEIMGIVRKENHDLLENRVLKDFLRRCIGLATMYQRRYGSNEKHKEHANVRIVARFRNLCVSCLAAPEFGEVSDIREFPHPNYVMQQDRLYSRIWSSYCDILRQEDVAEKLWNRRDEVEDGYARCIGGMDLHCSPKAKYRTPLWINPLDGRHEIFESPIWDNELDREEIESPLPPQEAIQTIDFTYPWDGRDELVYPEKHRNARPFIQNPHHPSLEPGGSVALCEILRKRDGEKLGHYFRQLHGLIGGTKWVVLTPDDWEPEWLEQVSRARPSVLSRDRMFLLWRSIASALGMMERRGFGEGDSLVIADGHAVPVYNAVELRFFSERGSGRVLPQRASVRLHSSTTTGCTDVRFRLGCSFSDLKTPFELSQGAIGRIATGKLSASEFYCSLPGIDRTDRDDMLFDGVKRYLREEAQGLVSYFDERDALSLVVQTSAEEVEFKTLVEHEECSPGGKRYEGEWTYGGTLQAGNPNILLNLLEGEQRSDARLKAVEIDIPEKSDESAEIRFCASMTPGQGLATVQFKADFFEKPLELDLTELRESEYTKTRIEREMKRHFPPVMPLVEASEDIWNSALAGATPLTVAESVLQYLQFGIVPDAATFAHAQPYWGEVDETGRRSFRKFGRKREFDEDSMSPIDRLKRENVFGNDPMHRMPKIDGVDWDKLFNRLVDDYKRGKKVLRLIAWTYQSESQHFEFLRRKLAMDYVTNGRLDIMEITFCSNCFQTSDVRVGIILKKVLERIGSGSYKQEELRLAYNLMQFHPDALEGTETEVCENAMAKLMNDYDSELSQCIWQRNYVKAAGYYLKSMLFLLHRRRFDASFFKQSGNWKPKGFLGESLPMHTDTLKGHERTRQAFINYVRGYGTIEGIPLGD